MYKVNLLPDRINITYTAVKGDKKGHHIELPLRLLVLGDFKSGGDEGTPLENRPLVAIDHKNFNRMMDAGGACLRINVPNKLAVEAKGRSPDALSIDIPINAMEDFEPDRLIEQIPELKLLARLRELLNQLKDKYINAKKRQYIIKLIIVILHKMQQNPVYLPAREGDQA